MIPIKYLADLFVACPNSYITEPYKKGYNTDENLPDVSSWIKDSNNEIIGAINWELGIIEIFQGYEYSEDIISSIGEEKFKQRNESAHQDLEDKLSGLKQAEKLYK